LIAAADAATLGAHAVRKTERPTVKVRRAAIVLPILLAGCAPTLDLRDGPERDRLVEHAPQPQPPSPPDPDCYPGNYRFAFLDTDTPVFRQGAAVKLTPSIDVAPAGTRPVPVRCTTNWTVTGPATLSLDRATLTIAPDAAPGSMVSVGFRHMDKTVTKQFRVVGRDELVLTGRWSQQSLDRCRAAEPVRELEFSPEDRFSVTFTPFETYRDYWGSYSFDPATGRIALKVEGGNNVPDGLDLEGQADMAGGRLVLKDMFLGSRDGSRQTGCIYTF
jgi:hypothetical protein